MENEASRIAELLRKYRSGSLSEAEKAELRDEQHRRRTHGNAGKLAIASP